MNPADRGSIDMPPAAVTVAGRSVRSVRIDTLRGISVFGILLVNIWSFIWGFESLRYGVLPDPATLPDRAAVFFVALFAEQKFYPVFAFLFGAGFALQTRSLRRAAPDWREVRRVYRRRLQWLLACGIVHGVAIWFGDILTVYGATGFLLLGLVGARLSRVVANLRNWVVVWLVLVALAFVVALPGSEDDFAAMAEAMIAEAEAARAAYVGQGAAAIALQRVRDYALVTRQSLYLVPQVMTLFLLGMTAVRMGWLTRPERHARLWKTVLFIGLLGGAPLSAAWAWVAVAEAVDPYSASPYSLAVFSLLPVGGTMLAAAYVAAIMLIPPDAMRRIGAWLAPVGAMALSNYLMQSVLCSLLLQGSGLALGAKLSPAQLLPVAFGVMALQCVLSRWWMARHEQGPVERLMRSYVRRGS